MKNFEKYQNTSTPRPLTSEIRMHAKNVHEKKGK